MVSKCDKPLEPLSTCPTYSNSFYPLQLFLPFHMYPNLPIHKNILYPYFVNNQLTFPPSQCPLVSANVINHSSLSAYVLHILTLSILCSSFTFPYLPKPFPFTNILHPYFC